MWEEVETHKNHMLKSVSAKKKIIFSHHLRMYPPCTHISTFDRAVPVAGSMARSRAARHCPDGLLPLAARLVALAATMVSSRSPRAW
jgi:hypothetical protein